jgi:DNA-binding MarR family transcriptional regulator
MSQPLSFVPEAANAGTSDKAQTGPLSGLVTMRMITIFSLLRRREILAHRQQFDLSEVEWHIMTLAGERAPFSLSRLAALTSKDEGQLSRAVKKMAARGLLNRQRKPGGPEIEIGLSSDGRLVYENMVERAIARDRWLTAGIAPDDLRALWRITDTMIERAQALVEDEPAPSVERVSPDRPPAS